MEDKDKDITRKCIFRQKTYAKRYCVARDRVMFSEYGMMVFRTNIEHILKDEIEEFVEDKTIFTCGLSSQLLECGDRFYIEELDMMVEIQDSFKTSKNSIVYYIQPKYITDELTTETYDKATEEVTKCKKMEELEEFINEIQNNKIYQKRIRHTMKSALR